MAPGFTKTQHEKALGMNAKLSFAGRRVLVTGGCGFLGARLAGDLLDKGAALVRVTDVRKLESFDELKTKYKQRVEFRQCDVRDNRQVNSLFENELPSDKSKIDAVVHIASYGMSGREMLNVNIIRDVNVKGTQNMIAACKAADCGVFVYTSTANVVFCGRVLENKDETLEYPPPDYHSDWYSRTKTIAEQEVLAANGGRTASGGHFRTCSIRPAAIYGEGEQRHIPRVIANMCRGLCSVAVGGFDTKVDWVYVDNLVFGHVLAADKLLDDERKAASVAGGQAYFISDENPINQMEFFRPLFKALGFGFPSFSIPVWMAYYPAWGVELVHAWLKGIYDFTPLMIRTEVVKISVTHYFSSAKARRDFGYAPVVLQDAGVKRMADHCKIVYGAEAKSAAARNRMIGNVLWYLVVSVAAAAVSGVLGVLGFTL